MSDDRIAGKGVSQKSLDSVEGGMLALLMEVNHLLNSLAETADLYEQVSKAVRERLKAMCVAVVDAGATLNVRALSATPTFHRDKMGDLLKEGCDPGELKRTLRHAGLYARKLRTERALYLTAVPLFRQRTH